MTQQKQISAPFKYGYVFKTTMKNWGVYDLIVHQGGTSSGKTYEILLCLFCKALEKRRTITIVGQDIPNLKKGAIRDAENILNSVPMFKQFVSTYNKSEHVYRFLNGSVMEFVSYDDAQDAKNGKRDVLFVNEVNGVQKAIFEELFDRTTEQSIVDYNPSAVFWIHTEYITRPNVIRIISNFTHNVALDPRIKQKILRHKKTNPNRWQVYGLGKTGKTEGIIYTNVEFIPADKFPKVQDLEKHAFGLDYGYSNDPLALVEAGLYQGNIYARLHIYKTGMGTPEIIRVFRMLGIEQWDLISMDDSQAKEQADILRNEGFFVESANRKGGSILSGIGLLQDYKIYIVDDKDNSFQTEQENYKWKVIRGETSNTPIDKFNHAWDALRYWALEMLNEPEYEEFNPQTFVI